MAYPPYLREKARTLRAERHLSIVEIAERLALPKTTVFYWVRDLPLGRPRRVNPMHPGTRAMQAKYRALREAAYHEGRDSFDLLAALDPTFRDFVCMYIGEGYKRSRNNVALGQLRSQGGPAGCPLDADGVAAAGPLRVQYHADQDLDSLRAFWGALLDVEPAEIGLQRKSNSGQLKGRTWRSRHGVLTVRTCDTLLRARLQGWIDRLTEQWLDSTVDGA